jgi:hypothetical protein
MLGFKHTNNILTMSSVAALMTSHNIINPNNRAASQTTACQKRLKNPKSTLQEGHAHLPAGTFEYAGACSSACCAEAGGAGAAAAAATRCACRRAFAFNGVAWVDAPSP